MVHVKSKYTDSTPLYTDDGTPILAHWQTRAFDFGDPAVKKTVNKIVTYCKSGQQLTLRFRVYSQNNEIVMPWTEIGQLGSIVNQFDKLLTGHFIQFEGKEFSSRQAFEFYGLSLQLGQDSNL